MLRSSLFTICFMYSALVISSVNSDERQFPADILQLFEDILNTADDDDDVPSKQISKANIVFVLADDLGYNDVGYHGINGMSAIRSPTIDSLAMDGVRLENYYVQPICSPTRSQLLLGRYQIHTGLQNGVFIVGDDRCLPFDDVTVAENLHSLGYATSMVGKWHVGMSHTHCLPTRRGFDNFFGYLIGSHDYYSHNTTYTRQGVIDVGYDLYENELPASRNYDGVHSTLLFTKRSEEIIENHNQSKPLFLYLAYQTPHTPLQSLEKYAEPYNDVIDDSDRRAYAGMVAMLDEGIHNVTEALKLAGLWENTVFIFSSDNGGHVLSGNNWPFRGEKRTLWEGGIKVAGFVHSPLLPDIIKGTVNRQLMHVTDWFPTLTEGIAGGNGPYSKHPLDGYNMWNAISKGEAAPRTEILVNIDPLTDFASLSYADLVIFYLHPRPLETFDPRQRAAIIKGDWKLITGFPDREDDGPLSRLWYPPPEAGGRALNKTYCSSSRDVIQLFNLKLDPYETCNVASWPWAFNKVWELLDRLKDYERTSVPAIPVGYDPRANPSLHGGVWVPWL